MAMVKTLAALALTVASAAALAQDTSADPNYGTIGLSAGFNNDPRVISVTSGGNLAASNISSNCAGFISSSPDVRLNYSAGSLPLIISVASGSDTTLVINDASGNWLCDDDGGVNGSNPSIRINNPSSGQYDIWVGSYRSGSNAPARLHISEVSSQ